MAKKKTQAYRVDRLGQFLSHQHDEQPPFYHGQTKIPRCTQSCQVPDFVGIRPASSVPAERWDMATAVDRIQPDRENGWSPTENGQCLVDLGGYCLIVNFWRNQQEPPVGYLVEHAAKRHKVQHQWWSKPWTCKAHQVLCFITSR